jgi:predicted ArsR family transcriptional regulator
MSEDDITKNKHGGNSYSTAAHDSIKHGKTAKDRKRVIEYIMKQGNATCDETAAALDMPSQTCSARFTELKRDGLIVSAGISRLTRNGRNAEAFMHFTSGEAVVERQQGQVPLF